MPLTLKEALSLAERNNPMLAAARSDAVAADARIGMENSKRRPSMSATSFLTDGDMGGILAGPDSIMPRTFNIYQEKRYFDQNLMLMFPLDVSGRLARNAGGARHRGAAAKLDAEQARQETVLDVRMAYYRAAYGAEAVAAFEEAAAVAEEQLKNDTAMFDAGKVPAYYLDRARAEVAARKQMLAEARSAAGVARIRLAVLAGLDAAAPVDVADTLAVLADFLPASGVAPDGESPEIAAARERAAAAEKSENAARRSSAPDVALSLMYDYTDPLEADTMSGTSAALVVSFPLLDGGMRRSSRREAAAMLESSRQELLAVKLRARANFESAKLEYETMLTSIEAAAEELDASEKTLAVVKLRYEAGKGIQVELLDAAATVTRARVARAGAIRDALIARDMMSAAAGKL